MSDAFLGKNRRIAAVLLLCLAIAAVGCARNEPPDPLDASRRNQADMTDGGVQGSIAAPAPNAFRCYTLNNCRGDARPGIATAKACIVLGGNSWTDRNGLCVSDIGE